MCDKISLIKCFPIAYVAGFAVLNLQKNDAKYEASVLQQSGFLAYSRTESSATEWSFKLNKDSSIRSENCGGVDIIDKPESEAKPDIFMPKWERQNSDGGCN